MIQDLVSTIEAALGSLNASVGQSPYDITPKSAEALAVRVQLVDWTAEDRSLMNAQPMTGREQMNVITQGRWQHWNYDKMREQNRKIIKAVQKGSDWEMLSVTYTEDEEKEFLQSEIAFTHFEGSPY